MPVVHLTVCHLLEKRHWGGFSDGQLHSLEYIAALFIQFIKMGLVYTEIVTTNVADLTD